MSDNKALLANFVKYKAAIPKVAKTALSDSDKATLLKKVDVVVTALKVSIEAHDRLIDEHNKVMTERQKVAEVQKKINDALDAREKAVDKKVDAFKKQMESAEKEADGVKNLLSGTQDKDLVKIKTDFDSASIALYASRSSV